MLEVGGSILCIKNMGMEFLKINKNSLTSFYLNYASIKITSSEFVSIVSGIFQAEVLLVKNSWTNLKFTNIF